MISDTDRAAIETHLDAVDFDALAPLTERERDLVSRALAPRPVPDSHPPRAA